MILLALNESIIMNADEIVFLVRDEIGQIYAVPYLNVFMKIKV